MHQSVEDQDLQDALHFCWYHRILRSYRTIWFLINIYIGLLVLRCDAQDYQTALALAYKTPKLYATDAILQ